MKLNSNKGQAALEFLMTYGWAILIVLIVLAVIWEWGLFNPTGTVRPGYSGFWGIIPYDSRYTSNGNFNVVLQNNIDATITLTQINISTGNNLISTNYNLNITPGNITTTLSIGNLDKLSSGSNYEVFLTIAYNDSRVNISPLLSSGRIWGVVE